MNKILMLKLLTVKGCQYPVILKDYEEGNMITVYLLDGCFVKADVTSDCAIIRSSYKYDWILFLPSKYGTDKEFCIKYDRSIDKNKVTLLR